MQVLGQRLLTGAALTGVELVVAVQVVGARGRVATPLAIVGRDVHAAVAIPAFGGQGFRAKIGLIARRICANSY